MKTEKEEGNQHLRQPQVSGSINLSKENLKNKVEWKYTENVYANPCPECPVKESVVEEGLYFSKG